MGIGKILGDGLIVHDCVACKGKGYTTDVPEIVKKEVWYQQSIMDVATDSLDKVTKSTTSVHEVTKLASAAKIDKRSKAYRDSKKGQ